MMNEVSDVPPQENPTEIVAENGPNADLDAIETPPPKQPKTFSRKWIGIATLGMILLGTTAYFGLRSNDFGNLFSNLTGNGAAKSEKSGKGGKGGKDQITPVKVAIATQKTVPVQLNVIGTVQASETVSVTPQATGRITGVFFKKGEEVQKGQLLFELDDRSQVAAIQQAQGVVAKDQSQVQQARATLAKDLGLVAQARATLERDRGLVRQAEATLAKSEAQAQYTQAQADRYNNLYKQGAVSQDQVQQYIANSKVAAATVQADREAVANAKAVLDGDAIAIANAEAVVEGDKAAIETSQAIVSADGGALSNTKVQSSYTKVYAPISGRAGNILITEGNVAQANGNNPLVVLQQIRPIQVAFAVPESNLPEIQKRLENGKLSVDVNFTGNIDRPISGVLSFINNTVDSTTGTIQLIGDFENTQGKLFPGQFVNTTLTLKQEVNATVVPSQAVQNGPKGQFVFVVKPDDTVENVPVVASSTIEGLSVIQKGVQPGDKVVIDGQANLVTGGKIKIQDEKPDSKGDPKSDPKSDSNADPKASKNGDTNAPSNAGENAGKDPSSGGKSGKSKRRSQKSGDSSEKPSGGTP